MKVYLFADISKKCTKKAAKMQRAPAGKAEARGGRGRNGRGDPPQELARPPGRNHDTRRMGATTRDS